MTASSGDNHDPFNTRRPTVYTLGGWRRILFYPAAFILAAYLRSLRIRFVPEEIESLRNTGRPRMFALWHNRSLVAPAMLSRAVSPEHVAGLVSPSKAAAWEAAFHELMGFQVIRGSTTRRSIQAGIEIVRILRSGKDAVVSPDGPSGPLYSFKEGALALARKEAVPLVFMVPNCQASFRLKTWDHHMVPLPFARVEVRIKVISPEDPVWELPAAEAVRQLRGVCLELTEDPFTLSRHE